MYARVPQSMAQFVLKIEKLSHIMGTAPIVELARAYGLHPRLWLLVILLSRKIVSGGKSMYQIDFLVHEFGLNLDVTRHRRSV